MHNLHSNLHDITNSMIEIPEVGVQLSEWRVALYMYTYVTGKRLHALPFHPTRGEPYGFA